MTTSAISAILQQDTNAHFQAWVGGVVTALFTTLGVTQTADTGQINPATVTTPVAIATSAGYVIGRFNDTLQSTTPIFFKLEFGTGTNVLNPQMWLTVGTSSNGSGTIGSGGGGAVSTRVACTCGATVASSGALASRFCYLATSQAGILWIAIGYNGVVAGSGFGAYGGFVIMRTTDSSGNASADGIVILTTATNNSSPGNQAANGYEQTISIANSACIPAAPAQSWNSLARDAGFILGLTTTLQSSNAYVAPIYTCDPVIRYSAYAGLAMLTDFILASTASFAMVGATPMTFISAGCPFGSTIGFDNNGSGATRTLVLPWQ